ncbi:hypothetical protein DI53_1636 [Sphingobacterium deserti]|uniref:Uncharacterized protein n=1 Tax=Sphingobacterium deserti TaxID=1229276 RepID=A0A0B8T192_9SPHI|nr:hypothetical protein DI53_1636 [Sphingobacterium deserti]
MPSLFEVDEVSSRNKLATVAIILHKEYFECNNLKKNVNLVLMPFPGALFHKQTLHGNMEGH